MPWGTDPLFMREGGKNYWFLNDHLGTPQQIVAENGGVVWKTQYAAFGKADVANDSAVTNNLRFPGQYYDEETGLHYNWNRYYDVESGRYSQTDPIGFEGGDVNLYGYAKSNTNRYIDYSGLIIDDCSECSGYKCIVSCACEFRICICYENKCGDINFLGIYTIDPLGPIVRYFTCDEFYEKVRKSNLYSRMYDG